MALAQPRVHFSLQHNQRPVFDLPAVDDWRSRIGTLFGREIADALIWVASDDGPTHLSGYVANPSCSRSHNRMQYLFLNGRYIRDRSLSHALAEAYRGLLMTGRYPVVFLALDAQPETVDVNVHPTKLEVRFQDSSQIYSQLLGTLRSRFLSTDLTARVQTPPEGVALPSDQVSSPADAWDASRMAQHQDQLVQWAQGRQPVAAAPQADPVRGEVGQPGLGLRYAPGPPADAWRQQATGSSGLPPGPAPAAPPVGITPEGYPALQVHNRYLITESDEGVVVIDQHALHERILYEELREKVVAGSLESQHLLVPEPVRLTPAEAAAVCDSRDLLQQLGMEVAPFGGDTVLISSYPAMLANIRPDELLRQLVEKLTSGGPRPDRRDLLDQLLHTISCKAAIKAGDRLSREEISALIERRRLVQDSHHCPHGRPTALVFTREELDRRFKRV